MRSINYESEGIQHKHIFCEAKNQTCACSVPQELIKNREKIRNFFDDGYELVIDINGRENDYEVAR